MVLVRMGDDEPDEILRHFLDEARIRNDEVDAGELGTREAYPAIDHEPFGSPFAAEAVEGEVHADLTETAERNEKELVRGLGHGIHLSCRP